MAANGGDNEVEDREEAPGLTHFAMVGQWTAPFAGLPTVATDGRTAIEELYAQDGKQFRAWKAGETAEVIAVAANGTAGNEQKKGAAAEQLTGTPVLHRAPATFTLKSDK